MIASSSCYEFFLIPHIFQHCPPNKRLSQDREQLIGLKLLLWQSYVAFSFYLFVICITITITSSAFIGSAAKIGKLMNYSSLIFRLLIGTFLGGILITFVSLTFNAFCVTSSSMGLKKSAKVGRADIVASLSAPCSLSGLLYPN